MRIALLLNKQSRGNGFPVQRSELVLPTVPVPSGPNSVLGQAVAASTLPCLALDELDRTNWIYRRANRITSAPHMSCHPRSSPREAFSRGSRESPPWASTAGIGEGDQRSPSNQSRFGWLWTRPSTTAEPGAP
jgi:hypothetical protein